MSSDVVIDLSWEGRERFEARSGGHRLIVDGEAAQGATPMQHMAIGIGGCMAIDLAHILGKMRTPPEAIRVRLEADRAPEPPRRFTRISLTVEIQGEVPDANLRRAVELSRDKYCSAWASVRPDVELSVVTSVSRP